jgi:hypothetical protein
LLFALAPRVFYEGYRTAPRIGGLSALADQQVAGACMALLSKVALFAAFSVLLWRLFDERAEDGDEGGGGWGRSDGDDDDAPLPVPSGAPAWLVLAEKGIVVDEPAPELRPSVTGAR